MNQNINNGALNILRSAQELDDEVRMGRVNREVAQAAFIKWHRGEYGPLAQAIGAGLELPPIESGASVLDLAIERGFNLQDRGAPADIQDQTRAA